MAIQKLKISAVLKKDLKVLAYLVSFGLGSYLAQRYVVDNAELSLVIGAAVNYILFRIEKELKNEGYIKAIK